jgi:hypothetical protein
LESTFTIVGVGNDAVSPPDLTITRCRTVPVLALSADALVAVVDADDMAPSKQPLVLR